MCYSINLREECNVSLGQKRRKHSRNEKWSCIYYLVKAVVHVNRGKDNGGGISA